MRPDHLTAEELAAGVILGDPAHDLPPSVRAWLRHGMAAFLTGEAPTLDQALGLDSRRWRTRERDRAIRRAAGFLSGTLRQKAAQLSKWARFPGRRWPGRAGHELRMAASWAGGRVPVSEKQLRRIITAR